MEGDGARGPGRTDGTCRTRAYGSAGGAAARATAGSRCGAASGEESGGLGESGQAGFGVDRGPRRVHGLHPGFQGRLRVGRIEALRGHEQSLVGVADRPVPQGEAAPDQFRAAVHRVGGRALPGGCQQPVRPAGMSRQAGVVRRGGQVCGTGILVGGEFRGPGQGGRALQAGRRRAGSGRRDEAGRERGVGFVPPAACPAAFAGRTTVTAYPAVAHRRNHRSRRRTGAPRGRW